MSRRITIVVAALVVLVVATALVAPWIVGFRVEAVFRKQIDEASQTLRNSDALNADIKLVHYDRGWFASSATTRITSKDGTVTLKNDITHGPYAVWGWAQISSTPILGPRVRAEFGQFFDGPVMTATTTIGFTGDVDVALNSPALARQIDIPNGPKLVWKGFDLHYSQHGGRSTLRARAPRLVFKDGEQVDVGFKNAQLKISGAVGDDWLDHPLRAGSWRSSANLSVKHGHFMDPKTNTRAEGAIGFKARSGMDKAHHVFVMNQFNIDDAHVDVAGERDPAGYTIQHGELRYSVRGIKAGLLARMVKTLRQTYQREAGHTDTDELNKELGLTLFAYGPRLFSDKARIRVRVPRLVMPAGKARGHVVVQLGPASPKTVKGSVAGLLHRLIVSMDASADDKLVRAWLQSFDKPTRVRQRLAMLTARHILQNKNGRYRVQLQYKNGQTILNGRPVPGLMDGLMRHAP